MILRVTNQEFVLLRKYFEDECGITFGDNKSYLIEKRLSDVAVKSGFKCFGDLYLKLIKSSDKGNLYNLVVDAITTNETLWFRDQYPYKILEDLALPELNESINNGKKSKITIWSAACSTGQEPYSIAMKVLDYFKKLGNEEECYKRVNVLASDISNSAVSQASIGKYDNTAIKRGLTSDFLEIYFKKENNEWIISDKVKNLITFRQFNLKEPYLRAFGPFEIIFLRNVIIYFTDSFKTNLFDRIARLMSPGGYMFLGSGETVSGYSNHFEILKYQGAVYYRLKR